MVPGKSLYMFLFEFDIKLDLVLDYGVKYEKKNINNYNVFLNFYLFKTDI